MLPTAVAAIALGLGLLGAVGLGMRLARRSRAWNAVRAPSPVRLPMADEVSSAAVLLAYPDGRLRYINAWAGELFDLNGALPTFWQLMPKVQPAAAFEALFGLEGRTNLTIGAQHLEVSSIRLTDENERRSLPLFSARLP